MNILAIPATNSLNGINRQLLGFVAALVNEHEPDATVNIIDINDYEMAIYSPERQAAGIPSEAQRFYDEIGAADAVIVSFAEYNGSFTPAWKNLFDWTSRIEMTVFQGTPVLLLAATPGRRAGASVLGTAVATAPFFGAELVGSLGVGSFGTTFDAEAGEVVDTELRDQLTELVAGLLAAANDG